MKTKPRKPRDPRARTTRARHKGIGIWNAQCRDCQMKFRVLYGPKPKFCISCKGKKLDIKPGRMTAEERAAHEKWLQMQFVHIATGLINLLLDAFGFTARSPLPRTLPTMTREDAACFIAANSGQAYPPSQIAADPEIADLCYRSAAKILHPDAGGSHEQFVRLQQAKEALAH